ncbi:MAG: hypothetical protein K1X75_09000 [Leptospirales bacterium]|nr:hypothetical protein [Leptospirales bacterium]
MGLLDKATLAREETSTDAPEAPGRSTLSAAAEGLRARAERLRQSAGSASSDSGIRIHGLRRRAEAMAGEAPSLTGPIAAPPRRGLRDRLRELEAGAQPASAQQRRQGLRARAEALQHAQSARTSDADLEAAKPPAESTLAGADALGPFAAALDDFDTSIAPAVAAARTEEAEQTEATHPVGLDPFDLALEEPPSALAGEEQSANLAAESPVSLQPEGGDILHSGEELDAEAFPDLTESLERDTPELKDEFAAPWTPQLVQPESEAGADEALEASASPASDSEEDPFGAWQQEAEKEAEQHAAQLQQEQSPRRPTDRDFLFDGDDLSTAPAESYIASQRKVDHYLALFDITKEISTIDRFEDLWDSLNYAVMGQVGAETICIFSAVQRSANGGIFYPVAHSGFEMPQGWALKRGDEIYDRLAKEDGVKYVEEFLNQPRTALSPVERRILETSRARLVVPLKNMGQLYGIAFVGAQLSGNDYTVDDLEFLSLLGEIAAVGADRVLSRLEFERDTEELRRRNMIHGSMFSLARRAANVRGLDELYDLLAERLREDFHVDSFSLVLLSPRDREYRIFAGNRISPDTMERFHLGVNSELVAMVSNLTRVYDLADFRNHPEIARNYTNDDLALMQHYWIAPLINMHWLAGFITIHRTTEPWTELNRELMVTAAEIISSAAANCIILGERESLFRDPFSPLEERLKDELRKAREFNAPLTLVDFRIKNIRRLNELAPAERVADFLAGLTRSMSGLLFETDFMARVAQGRFALILPGRDREESEIFIRKLKAEIRRARSLPGSPVDPQLVHSLVSYPRDAQDAGKMLSVFD